MAGIRSTEGKMKYLFILITISGLLLTRVEAQQVWSCEIVDSGLTYPWGVAAKVDNDQDYDLIFMDGDSLIWYENLQPGWIRHCIDPSFLNAGDGTFDAFDMDLDGDIDFTINDWEDPGTLAWYENMANGTSWRKHVISDSLRLPSNRLYSYGDIDQDGDVDVVTTALNEGLVYWFENVTGDTIWREHAVVSFPNPSWSTVGDMDGDNDLDIIAGGSNSIRWMENRLPDTTWPLNLIGNLSSSYMGLCADIDGDSDFDVVTHSNGSNVVVWYANPTWDSTVVGTGLNAWLGNARDIDRDGDQDITYGVSGSISWTENMGNGADWHPWRIDSTAMNYFMAPMDLVDINLDSFPDLVASKENFTSLKGDIRWYANPMTGIQEDATSGSLRSQPVVLYQNIPNPFNSSTTIMFDIEKNADGKQVVLAIYDICGNRIRTMIESTLEPGRHRIVWDGRDENGVKVASGIYLYNLETENGGSTRKMTIIQ